MILPKIIWNGNTLSPAYPPINKTPDASRADRTDTYSTAGIRQSITMRVDHFNALEFPNVPVAEIAAWQTFMDTWALLGNPFDYYPDATSGTHETYTLDDDSFEPKFAAKGGWYKFTLTFRKQIT